MAYGPYMRIDAEASFSPPRLTPLEGPEEITIDRRVMDAGAIEAYRLWWVTELCEVHVRGPIILT
ncbi:hypothetical protein KI387_005621 [Taxus chinensis]|uniref:Uncharacterized protein n=1 Tax=Taxus chinensis TaxID=29808 RepID=A0AA38LHS5_TAXCH|nr:hypothetical protein KI387_005621 [Taxus chinensis]